MHGGIQNNAMAEVALALAMGFFSIMVLAMVSMGATPDGSVDTHGSAISSGINVATTQKSDADKTLPVRQAKPGSLIIYFGGQFLDAQLSKVDPKTLALGDDPVLAVAPDLPLKEVLDIRSQLSESDITVTILDGNWIKAIKEKAK